jgi:hypothetical protein
VTNSDFAQLFHDLLIEFCRPRGLDPSLVDYTNEPWSQRDIDDFMSSTEIFQSVGGGVFRWNRGHSLISLFGHGSKGANPRPPTLARESLTAMGSVAYLHYQLGWPLDLIEVETKGYVFDFAAYQPVSSSEDHMVIAGEAKSSATEAEAWLRLLRACAELPAHALDTHANPRAANAHKKRVGLDAERPEYLWLVAPGFRLWVACSYEGSQIVLASGASEAPVKFDERVD